MTMKSNLEFEDIDRSFDVLEEFDMFGAVDSAGELAESGGTRQISNLKLNRRAFLTGTAGVAVGVAFGTGIPGNIGKAIAQGRFNPSG